VEVDSQGAVKMRNKHCYPLPLPSNQPEEKNKEKKEEARGCLDLVWGRERTRVWAEWQQVQWRLLNSNLTNPHIAQGQLLPVPLTIPSNVKKVTKQVRLSSQQLFLHPSLQNL
jgi:hypothetical protein